MRITLFALLLSLLFLANAGVVLQLEEEELEGYIKKKDIVMVEIYSPTCPHCKALAPEYEKAAKIARDAKKSYNFVKINGVESPNIHKIVPIRGFPALRLFVKGASIPYDGNRTSDAILQFIDKKIKDQSVFLKTEEEIKAILNGTGVRVNAYI